jgi:hypothetical protein
LIISPEQARALEALDAYAISITSRLDPAKGEDNPPPWENREVSLTVTISGFGESQANATPTWAASATDTTIEAAFARALVYAPSQLEECNARAANRLDTILPEYDPENKRPKPKRSSSLNHLDANAALAALGLS